MRDKQDTRIRNRNDDIVNRWLTEIRIARFRCNSETQIYTFSTLIDNLDISKIVEIEYRAII